MNVFFFQLIILSMFLLIQKQSLNQNINTPENFPNPDFRAVIEKFMGVEPDGSFTSAEASIKSGSIIYVSSGSVKGIEYFTNITYLHLSTGASELDLSKNVELRSLSLETSNLKNLDLTHNTKLEGLGCFYGRIENINILNNPELTSIQCSQNSLTKLDVSNNPQLSFLWCWGNQIQTLDISNNPELKWLRCGGNDLSKLDLSNNPKLEKLECSGNNFTNLDLTNNSKLIEVETGGTFLEQISFPQNPIILNPAVQVKNCGFKEPRGASLEGIGRKSG